MVKVDVNLGSTVTSCQNIGLLFVGMPQEDFGVPGTISIPPQQIEL